MQGTQDPNIYLSGQGKLYIGPVGGYDPADPSPVGFVHVGNVPSLVLALATEELSHKESFSGQRQEDFKLITQKTVGVNFTLEDFKVENLALALYGEVASEIAGSIADPPGESIGDPPLDQLIPLAHQGITAATIKDSDSPQNTLPAAGYRIEAAHGGVVILDKTTGGPYVAPFKVAYSWAARDRAGLFTEPVPEKMLLFHGLNTADSDRPVVVELFRVQIKPLASLPLIQDEIAKFDMVGSALLDPNRDPTGVLGQTGRLIMVPPA